MWCVPVAVVVVVVVGTDSVCCRVDIGVVADVVTDLLRKLSCGMSMKSFLLVSVTNVVV